MNPRSEYVGKDAYRGEVVANYDRDRQTEEIWTREQVFVTEWARQTLRPGHRVLDLPTGTGRFVEILLGQGARVVAADISTDMLAEVQAKVATAPRALLELREADAERLPFEDGEFDHVLSWRFLHLLPASVVGRVINEFRRVVRGTIVVQVFQVRPADRRHSLGQRAKDILRPLWRRLRRAPGRASTPWAHITSYSHDETRLLALFKAAGLCVVRTHTFELDAGGLANRVYFLEPVISGGANS